MIQQFKNLNFFNIFLLLILVYILRIGFFLNLPQDLNTGFWDLSNRLLLGVGSEALLDPFDNVFFAGLIVFIQALLFNRIITVYNVIGKSTFLPALTYILASSILSTFLYISPPLICNFLLLYILYRILESIKSPAILSTMFDLGMVAALGTVIYFPFCFIIVVLWIALIIFRPFNWREWLSVLIGYITVFLFLAVYYLWNNRLLDFFDIWKPLTDGFPLFISIQVLDYIVLLPIAIGLILGFFQLRENFYKSYVQTRKVFLFLFFVFAVTFFSFYVKSDYRVNHFLLSVIPVATLLAYYFLNAAKRWFYESLYFLIVVFVIYFQFV